MASAPATLAIAALAAPASAATVQVTHLRFGGTVADAEWAVSSPTSFTDTFLAVSTSKQGFELHLEQFTANLDADGNLTGGTELFANLTSGFTVAVDTVKLATASVDGLGLPATTCILDASGNPIEPCADTTIDLNASWVGQGRSPGRLPTITSSQLGSA